MKSIFPITMILLMQAAGSAHAGSLANGEWTAGACGEKPALPVVDDHDIDSFNKSVKAINDWQLQARTYYGCVVNEANADNGVIANKANQEQANYKQDFEGISAAIEAGKKKLEKK